jgi:hypothetical protein
MSLPATNDGKIHRSWSGQESPPIPNLLTAQTLAGKMDIVTGQPSKFATFADDMVTVNPDLLAMVYTSGPAYFDAGFPERWYAHDSTGRRLGNPAYGTYVFETDGYTVSATRSGITAANWRHWRALSIQDAMDSANAAYATDPFTGFWVDSEGPPYTYNLGPPVKPGAGRNWTLDEWAGEIWTLLQQLETNHPSTIRFANGFNKDKYGPLLLSRVNGAMREAWLRSPTALPGSFPGTATLAVDLQQIIDAQVAGKKIQLYAKLWSTATVAEKAHVRNYAIACYLLAEHGGCFLEFTSAAKTVGLWAQEEWTAAIYDVALGAPLDTHDALTGYLASGVYKRRYTNGLALLNPTGSAISVALDRAYKTVAGVAVSSPLSVPAKTGLVLLTAVSVPPLPDPPPVVGITAPADGATLTTTTATLSATVTAAAGIASVMWRILGSTDWVALPPVGGANYSGTVTLNSLAGSSILNTISVRCIDLAGQSTSAVVEVTVALPFAVGGGGSGGSGDPPNPPGGGTAGGSPSDRRGTICAEHTLITLDIGVT